MVKGELKVGDVLEWCQDLPFAYVVVRVEEIKGEQARTINGLGETAWVSETALREACQRSPVYLARHFQVRPGEAEKGAS